MFILRHVTFSQCHKEKKVIVNNRVTNIILCEETYTYSIIKGGNAWKKIKGVMKNDQTKFQILINGCEYIINYDRTMCKCEPQKNDIICV